jgi:hypothetical protein
MPIKNTAKREINKNLQITCEQHPFKLKGIAVEA